MITSSVADICNSSPKLLNTVHIYKSIPGKIIFSCSVELVVVNNVRPVKVNFSACELKDTAVTGPDVLSPRNQVFRVLDNLFAGHVLKGKVIRLGGIVKSREFLRSGHYIDTGRHCFLCRQIDIILTLHALFFC